MNLYIAGASAEREMIADLIARCCETGINITLDWPSQIEANGGIANGMAPEDARAFAFADLAAVSAADVVWLVSGDARTCGAWVEFGYALARGKQTVVSGNLARCIFAHLAGSVFLRHEDAFDRVVELGTVY